MQQHGTEVLQPVENHARIHAAAGDADAARDAEGSKLATKSQKNLGLWTVGPCPSTEGPSGNWNNMGSTLSGGLPSDPFQGQHRFQSSVKHDMDQGPFMTSIPS